MIPSNGLRRAIVRNAVQQWFDPSDGGLWATAGGVPSQLDKVWTSFPNEIDFRQWERLDNIDTRAQAVVYITGQNETRETVGGNQGWKYVHFSVVLQVFALSVYDDADAVMTDIDALADALHARAVADHNFGQDPSVIFKAAEPGVDLLFGEPLKDDNAQTQVWFQLAFTVDVMYQA